MRIEKENFGVYISFKPLSLLGTIERALAWRRSSQSVLAEKATPHRPPLPQARNQRHMVQPTTYGSKPTDSMRPCPPRSRWLAHRRSPLFAEIEGTVGGSSAHGEERCSDVLLETNRQDGNLGVMAYRSRLANTSKQAAPPEDGVPHATNSLSLLSTTPPLHSLFFDLLRKDDPDRQMVYYQPGIGTYVNPGMWMPIVVQISKLADQAFAWFLDSHIMGGYKFLMQNWRKGDRICLFGFSRGAYTARCLAGMLHKVGLLPSSNQEQVLFAYGMYKDNSKRGWEQAAGFKKTFSRSVEVEFIGVWDTVSAVGVVWPRHLPFSSANTTIKTFRHALSLDERRVRFQPNLWHREAGGEAAAKRDPEHASLGRHFHPVAAVVDEVRELKTDVQEVWFAGCHSDVGGGSVANTTPHSLSYVTLRWMIEQTIRTQTGIMYNPGALRSIGFATTPFIEAHIYTLDKYFYSKGLGINDISKAGHGANEEREVTVSKKGSIEPPKEQESENLCHRCKMECQAKEREKRHRKVEETDQPATEVPEETPGSSSGSSVPSSSRESQDSAPRDSYEREGTLVERTRTRDSTDLHRPGTEVLAPKRTFAKRLKSMTTRRKDKRESPLKGKNHPRDATDNVTVAGESDEERQRHDVLSPVHDELKRMPLWWILEVLPMVKAWQNENGEWERGLQVNFGRPRRIISTEEPVLHISVKQRMEADIGYQPRAKMLKGIQRARWTE